MPSTAADSSNTPPVATNDPVPPVDPVSSGEQSLQLTICFPKSDASGLTAVERTVTVKNQEVIKALFAEFANPPAGTEKPLPEGTALLGAEVNPEGLATINLSSDFSKNFSGGSTAEQMTIYSIVNTLTALPNVQSVQFLMEGQKSISLLGNTDTNTPFERKESLIVK